MENTESTVVGQPEVQTNEAPAKQQATPIVQIPAELNQQQALQVLVDAAKIAQSKGIFSLDDAELVNKAVRAFTPKGPVPTNG